jgi:CheY-like chemotaxis protein
MAHHELGGLKVLVVEDDPLISLLLEEMLDGLGCTLAATASAVEGALSIAANGEAPDIAILDVNLNGKSSKPVADVLVSRNVPVVFATGYGSSGVKGMPGHCVVLEKPFTQKQVGEALSEAMARTRT